MSSFTPIHSSGNESGASEDARLSNLRRPQTTNTQDFWYISAEKWDELVGDVADTSKQKVALNNLRKYDAAGRIMETSEGAVAVEACSWCNRDDSITCRVFADGHEKACAYCKRMAKSGCTASLVASPPSMEERVAELERQLVAANEKIAALEEQGNGVAARLDNAIRQFAGCFTDIETIWRALWPGAENE